MIGVLLALLAVHVAASDVCFLVIHRMLRGKELATCRVFVLTRGLGPFVVAFLTYLLLFFFPGQSRGHYLSFLAVIFLLPVVLFRTEFPQLRSSYAKSLGWIRRRLGSVDKLTVLTAFFVLLSLVFGIFLPMVEHDALAAAIEARIAVQDSSFANYLAVTEPDPATGYFMETFRTPSLQSLYVALAWLSSLETLDIMILTTSPIFAIHCLLIVAFETRRRFGSRAASWAIFLLASTPIFFYMSYNNGIDTFRLYIAFAALAWFTQLAESGSHRLAAVTGAVSGLALFTHLLSVPALAGAVLGFFFSAQSRWQKKLTGAIVWGLFLVLFGGTFHYLASPALTAQLERSIGPRWAQSAQSLARGDLATALGLEKPSREEGPRTREGLELEGWDFAFVENLEIPGELEPSSAVISPDGPVHPFSRACRPKREIDPHAVLLEIRGQGGTKWERILLGRLQMFTGLEHFGILFYAFVSGLLLWWLRGRRERRDLVFVTAAVAITVVVLSGVRKLSWSNPRYIASLALVAAHFSGPLLAWLEERWLRTRWRKVALVGLIVAPVLLATAVRGVKIELTNPGDFYSDFRSLKWVEIAIRDPRDALFRLGDEYLGIRRTARHFFADPDQQLRHAHDYLNAVLWVRDHLPEDAHVLVYREARFFYYGERRGSVWYSPAIDQQGYRRALTPADLALSLRRDGVTHVLVDEYSTRLTGYADRCIGLTLASPILSELTYEHGTARVYRLRSGEEIRSLLVEPRRP